MLRSIADCIGVCYLAAAVEHDVETLVMPENYYNDGIFESLRQLLKKTPVELVAISSMTGAFNQAERLAKIAKEAGAFVVMGGFHPTALPEGDHFRLMVSNRNMTQVVILKIGRAHV